VTVGLSPGMASEILTAYRGGGNGVNVTAAAVLALKLHLGDPGVAATTTPSTNTTRQAVTFGAYAAGAISLSNSPTWSAWANGNETISHLSCWDSTTVGTFKFSAALTTPKAVANGDTLTQTSLSVSLAPIAA